MYLHDGGTKSPVSYFLKREKERGKKNTQVMKLRISFVLCPTGYITMSLPIMEPLMVAGGTPGLAS